PVADRIAVIGCGFFAQNHLHAWREIEGVEVVAVCDTDFDKAEATAARHDVPRAYADAALMLAEQKPDLVDIVTTSPTHRPLVELAAQHAPLVVRQKPLADTDADGVAMVSAAARHGRTLLIHENVRWQRPYAALRELAASGALGATRFAQISFRHGVD